MGDFAHGKTEPKMDIDYSKIEHYLAVIDLGGGRGSWAVSKTNALSAINNVVRLAKADWKIKGKGWVDVYDVTNSDRWTQGQEPRDIATGKPLPFLYPVRVVMK